jgi:hypothetical protein
MPGIVIVGVVCDYDGRKPECKKVQKILDWPTPRNIKDARAFIGLVVYYRIFIVGFAIIAEPYFYAVSEGSPVHVGHGKASRDG